jgi:hypothetical protein
MIAFAAFGRVVDEKYDDALFHDGVPNLMERDGFLLEDLVTGCRKFPITLHCKRTPDCIPGLYNAILCFDLPARRLPSAWFAAVIRVDVWKSRNT